MSKYISVKSTDKLIDLVNRVGDKNISNILSTNGLERAVNIGREFADMCNSYIQNSEPVSWKTKTSILNAMSTDSDVFEKASLQDDDDWKVLAKTGTFNKYLKIPTGIYIPDGIDVLGNGIPVAKHVYDKAMESLADSSSHEVDPNIYNEYNASSAVIGRSDYAFRNNGMLARTSSDNDIYKYFHLPWGEIILYDALSDTSIEFPVYPEEYQDKRSANYDQMPDILYQYEPWMVYQSSGPRQNTFTFHMHRQMWTGNESDGQANRLIRFCESCVYPKYAGSAVITPTVQLRIHGNTLISGILTEVSKSWSGPISSIDAWYLEFTLELSITEVSDVPLNYDTVRSMGLIG